MGSCYPSWLPLLGLPLHKNQYTLLYLYTLISHWPTRLVWSYIMLVWPQVILLHLDRKLIVNISESVFDEKGTFPLWAGFCFTTEIQPHTTVNYWPSFNFTAASLERILFNLRFLNGGCYKVLNIFFLTILWIGRKTESEMCCGGNSWHT